MILVRMSESLFSLQFIFTAYNVNAENNISNDCEFNPKSIKATGNKVALQKLDRKKDYIQKGVLIPEESIAGYTATKAKVLSIGPDALFENFKVLVKIFN